MMLSVATTRMAAIIMPWLRLTLARAWWLKAVNSSVPQTSESVTVTPSRRFQ